MSQKPDLQLSGTTPSLSTVSCALVLTTAFLGWMCAGWQLAISSLAMRDASASLLQQEFVERGITTSPESPEPDPKLVSQFDKNQDGILDSTEKSSSREAIIGEWFGRLIASFLLGAALGGYVFGWVGDRFGRARAMGRSILWYSVFSAVTVFVTDPWQLLVVPM